MTHPEGTVGMTPEQTAAEALRVAVMKRVGVRHSHELVCPRERSEMTPCVARDASYALADDGVCVGCGQNPIALLAEERGRSA